MNHGMGDMIFGLREEAGFSQRQLCRGLCSVPQMARMERNQVPMDCFMLDCFLGRLGKSTERLEYVLTAENYELYELQYMVQKDILYGKLEKAEKLLERYKSRNVANKPLHLQYLWQMYAQTGWIRGWETENILAYLERAIRQTMPLEEIFMKESVLRETVLSADEIRLLLFRWEVCMGTEWERPLEELTALLDYIGAKKMVEVELVKVYPYAVLLLGKAWDQERQKEILIFHTKEALAVLQSTGKILYMPEILEQYANLLEHCQGKKEEAEQLRTERIVLLLTEKEYGIRFEKFRLFRHVNRRFELDYELIRRTRIARKISQEKLCENICTQEEISRIEGGKRKPRDKKLHLMMERMNRRRRRFQSVVMTDDYEVLELKRQYFMKVMRFETNEARELVNRIEEKLDSSIPENRQFLSGENIKLKSMNQELDFQTCIEQLWTVLNMTLDMEEERMQEFSFTTEEHCILNEIAANYSEKGEKERAIQIWEMQIENMEKSSVHPVFHILEWELAKGNLATSYEETGKTSKAIEVCKEKVRVSLEAGKGNGIGRSFITIASALEKENSEKCAAYFYNGLKLLGLYQMNYIYDVVDSFINSSEFLYKEQFNRYRDQIHRLDQQSAWDKIL